MFLGIDITDVKRFGVGAGDALSVGNLRKSRLQAAQVAGGNRGERSVAEKIEHELKHAPVQLVGSPIAERLGKPVEPLFDRLGQRFAARDACVGAILVRMRAVRRGGRRADR